MPQGGDPEITGVTMDSRSVRPGYLFLACKGLSSHGMSFAAEAIERGAAAIAWEPDGFEAATLPLPAIRVEKLGQRAGEIAAKFYGYPSEQLDVIGITGTNGKTSVAHYLAQSLDRPEAPAAIIGTLGVGLFGQAKASAHTTPDVVSNHRLLAEFLGRGAASVAMEVSSHALDQGRVNALHFTTAVFTNLSHDHLDYHGSLDAYAAVKRKLFFWPGLEAAVINADDEVGVGLLQQLPSTVRGIAYSLSRPVAGCSSVWASNIEANAIGMAFDLHTPWGGARVQSQLVAEFNVANLLATAAVLLLRGETFTAVVERLQQVRPVTGRMETFGGGGRPRIIIDYAHTPDALKQSLQAARAHAGDRVICVFGCGGDRDTAKRPEMGRVAESLADIAVLTNDNPRSERPEQIIADIRSGLSTADRFPVVLDRKEAIEAALASANAEDVVLIAGKGHEDYQIIGKQRFRFSDRAVVMDWLGARS